jgi:Zn-dependent protease
VSQQTKARCDTCGITSNDASAFIRHRENFDRTRLYCPQCWKGKSSGDRHGFVALWLAYAVATLTLSILWPHRLLTMTMVNFCWFQVCAVVAVVLHEFGHAFAARRMGHRVFRVTIGTGKAFWRGRILGFDTEMQFPFVGGRAMILPTEVAHFRWKQFLILLAGPLVNVVVLLYAIMMLYPQSLSWSAMVSHDFQGWQMFAWANALTVILNLLPHTANTSLGPLPSDGKQLLGLLFRPAGKDTEAHAAWFCLEAAQCKDQGRPDEALRWLERGRAVYPQNSPLRIIHAQLLLETDCLAEGREELLAVIRECPLLPATRARLRATIAFTNVLLDDDSLLDEADAYSAEALAMFPWDARMRTTRGAFFIARKRFQDALPILRAAAQATRHQRLPHAEAVCLLAIAEAGVGNRAAVEKLRDRARSVEPNCHLLWRVEAALHALTIIEFQNLNGTGTSPS